MPTTYQLSALSGRHNGNHLATDRTKAEVPETISFVYMQTTFITEDLEEGK
jgi:hypothetical protein